MRTPFEKEAARKSLRVAEGPVSWSVIRRNALSTLGTLLDWMRVNRLCHRGGGPCWCDPSTHLNEVNSIGRKILK